MSKYEPLTTYLRTLKAGEWTATFADIEKVLGFPLPASARNHPAWWGNQTPPHSQTQGWMDAGWETTDLNITRGHVTFVRRHGTRSVPRIQAAATTRLPPKPVASRGDGTETPQPWDVADKVLLAVGFTWRPLGRVVLDERHWLVFPKATAEPGLYRFTIRKAGKTARYIGESENIQRRFLHYRNPGPTQAANIRLNERFLADLAGGAEIAVAIATDGFHLNLGDGPVTPDLRVKSVRLLIESAALQSGGARDIESLNRTT
jgi:hypothetical protein